MVEEPVERVFERVQYIPVETQIVHYPERDNYVPAQTKVRTEYVGVQPGVTTTSAVQGVTYQTGSRVGTTTNVTGGSGVGQYSTSGYTTGGYQQVVYGQPTSNQQVYYTTNQPTTTQQVVYSNQPVSTYVSGTQPVSYVSGTGGYVSGGYVTGGSGVRTGYVTGGSGVRTNQNATYVSSGSGVKQASYETSTGYYNPQY